MSSFSMPLARSWQIIPPLSQNRDIWVFSYYAVIWKVLEHFITVLKISLKLKANQFSKKPGRFS